MADIGGAAGQVKSSEQFAPFTQVILQNDAYDAQESVEYTAGSDSGRSLTVQCPFASQDIANAIAQELNGTTYQPYTATGAVIDPAVELGDDLSVMGLTGRIFAQDISFGGVMRSDVGAPGEEEIDHEFHFEVKRERKISRGITGAANKAREAKKDAIEAKAGLDQITDPVVNPDTGEIEYYLAENKVYASITDNTDPDNPKFKKAYLMAKVTLDPATGELKSLAEISADTVNLKGRVIKLEGDVRVLGNFTVDDSGYVYIKAPQTHFSNSDIFLTNGSRLIIGGETFTLHGTTYTAADLTYVDSVTSAYISTSGGAGTTAITTPTGVQYFHPGSYHTKTVRALLPVSTAPQTFAFDMEDYE